MADECFANVTNILSHMLSRTCQLHTVAGQIWLQTWGQDKLPCWVSLPDEGRGYKQQRCTMPWAGGCIKISKRISHMKYSEDFRTN